jgi:two-component sensor histidine kinase
MQNFWQKIYKNILLLGVEPHHSLKEKSVLMQLNTLSLFWVIPLLNTAVFFIVGSHWQYGFLMFVSVCLLFLVPVLNSFKNSSLSAYIYILTVHFNLIISCVLTAFHYETYLLLFPLVLSIQQIHTLQKNATYHILLTIILYSSIFILSYYFPYQDGIIIENPSFSRGNVVFSIVLFLIVKLQSTYIQQTNEQKLSQKIQELEEKLTEKEDLIHSNKQILGQIHLRMKNNMSFVSNLLSLQRFQFEDKQFNDVLQECSKRIQNIANVHQLVYQNQTFQTLNANEIIEEMLDKFRMKESVNRRTIHIKSNLETVYLSPEQTIALVMIVQEVVSNSLKHAFKSDGTIYVNLRYLDKQIFISIHDDGIGFQYSKTENYTTMGMSLIELLSDEIKAHFEYKVKNGTLFSLVLEER